VGVPLATLALSRLVINTGLRMIYPFLPAFGRGLGVPLQDVARLVSLRGFAGLVSPLFGPLSERYGRRPVLAASLLLMAAGCAVVIVRPGYWFFGAAILAIAVAKVIYDPAMQAHVGDNVAYARRGRAIAITEFSWSGAFLLGVPALSFIIDRLGWRSPFALLGILAALAALALWRAIPVADNRQSEVTGLRQSARILAGRPIIWAASLYIMLVTGANELLLIVYGGWMEQSFGLRLTQLGLATAVIGASEVGGELFSGLAVDRLGKRPVILMTGTLAALLYVVIPSGAASLGMALLLLFLAFFCFEVTIVGGIPLMTELVPSARSLVLSMILAAGSLGRAVGALLGPPIWQQAGFTALGLTAGLTMLGAMVILAAWVREGREDPVGNSLDRGDTHGTD
jgi:predicted MFS family arabinose efflux permease